MLLAYARVSTAEQAADGKTSLDEQIRIAQGFAMAKGFHAFDVQTYVDAGVSGTIPLKFRPEGSKLLEDMRPGDIVVASALDRMFRSARDALETAEFFKQKGVDLVLFNFGVDPIGKSAIAECFFTMLAAFAQLERATIHDRMVKGRKAKAARGGHIGGHAPYGYRKIGNGREARLELDETEQRNISVIKEVYSRCSPKEAARELTAQNILPRSGKPWDNTQLRRIAQIEERAH